MARLASFDILNAPSENVLISVPAGGVFILKQLLAQWLLWDTEIPADVDQLDNILAQTMKLSIEELPMNLVFSGFMPALHDFPSGASTNVPLSVGIIDNEFLVWDAALNRLVVQKSCQLHIFGQTRVHGGEQASGSFTQFAAIRKNGAALGIAQNSRIAADHSCNVQAADNFAANNIITMTYFNNQGDLVFLRSPDTRLWVIRVG